MVAEVGHLVVADMETHKKGSSIKLKLLRQYILDSVDDDSADRVLHKLVFNFLRKRRVSIIRKRNCSLRRWRQRKSWEEFRAGLTERQFRRYFHKARECFDLTIFSDTS